MKFTVGFCLAIMMMLTFFASTPMAQEARSNREAVSQLIAWVKSSGENGLLEGRLAKALGSAQNEDLSVKARLLMRGSSVWRLMVPNDSDVLIMRRSLGCGGERIWKASLVRDGEIATLEAAIYIDWKGIVRIDRVYPERGDDGFFSDVKTWYAERKKQISTRR